jgi:hypothetical protein
MLALEYLDGTVHHLESDDAFVRVRLSEPPGPTTASVTVYLTDGTALVVCARDLVRLTHADAPRRT